MKHLNEILFPGDEIEIESKVYACVPELDKLSCKGCIREEESISCKDIRCTNNRIILVEQPQVFKPTLLVVGESIEILGIKLLIKEDPNRCGLCALNGSISFSTLCLQVDCSTNNCIISNEVVL